MRLGCRERFFFKFWKHWIIHFLINALFHFVISKWPKALFYIFHSRVYRWVYAHGIQSSLNVGSRHFHQFVFSYSDVQIDEISKEILVIPKLTRVHWKWIVTVEIAIFFSFWSWFWISYNNSQFSFNYGVVFPKLQQIAKFLINSGQKIHNYPETLTTNKKSNEIITLQVHNLLNQPSFA